MIGNNRFTVTLNLFQGLNELNVLRRDYEMNSEDLFI